MRPSSRLPVSTDVGDLTPDVRRLFDEMARGQDERRRLVTGECQPAQDVLETERTIELVLDLPGVDPSRCRVLLKNGIVLVVGEKERPDLGRGATSFHLVERDFGRFVRAIKVHAAIDGALAQARMQEGELRIVLPKRLERRGHEIAVAISTDGAT